MGYVARDIDGSDKRAKEIRLTQRGMELARDSQAVIDEVRHYYSDKIGPALLDSLEGNLREAVRELDFDYLPETWVDRG
jgi:DNA-binding MarR family transcriptional regulator